MREGHDIAENVHSAIERSFPKVKHIMVHVNPAEEREQSAGANSTEAMQ
ncbi:MAG: cation transporter dimerization domain-containing protein [Oscillospiraceae bacterium]